MAAKHKLESKSVESSSAISGGNKKPLLCEVAWEVCRQMGGIYTVIRSKAPNMMERWGKNYCVIGPYVPNVSELEFEAAPPPEDDSFGKAVGKLQQKGMDVRYGQWIITGRPRTILFNPSSVFDRLDKIKYFFWEKHDISLPAADSMLDEVAAFSYMVEEFFRVLSQEVSPAQPVIGHFHEWLAGAAIPGMRTSNLPVAIVFTTHATQLCRYLAMADPWFYDHVPFVNWQGDARRFNIEPQVRLERSAAHGAHVFTTVSDITAIECEHLLNRKPDLLLPNGLNIERFVALHEFQNLHLLYKEQINQFVMCHFFHSYPFDLDKTIYFFSSGRYEYRNKGFDLVTESLARLNERIRQAGLERTVVFFLITRHGGASINAEVLRKRAQMEELRNTCEEIMKQVGEGLFVSSARGESPKLDGLADEYWMLRLRRIMQAWKSVGLPPVSTHDFPHGVGDEALNNFYRYRLTNSPDDPVKVVYHPDFISSTDPLFRMDYDHFVRGCHMGIFPSIYEPWGYTPLECAARGIPAVTSDLSGFGTYLLKHMPDYEENGLYVLGRRNTSFEAAADRLTDIMFEFLKLDRRERIALRNKVENTADRFDWANLGGFYAEAHELALQRTGGHG
jgi:glycogen(starch) synthase